MCVAVTGEEIIFAPSLQNSTRAKAVESMVQATELLTQGQRRAEPEKAPLALLEERSFHSHKPAKRCALRSQVHHGPPQVKSSCYSPNFIEQTAHFCDHKRRAPNLKLPSTPLTLGTLGLGQAAHPRKVFGSVCRREVFVARGEGLAVALLRTLFPRAAAANLKSTNQPRTKDRGAAN